MEYHLAFFYTALAVGILTLYGVLKRANDWFYTIKFGSKKYHIPPGDMGWPYVGNTLFYFRSSLGGNPSSFLSYFVTRFGPGGMYKAHLFGKPSIIVTKPEIIRKILMDEENFKRGLPNYMSKLVGLTTSIEQDKIFRRLTSPIKSQGLLSYYFKCIDEVVRTAFEKYAAKEEPIEFLSEMQKLAFKVFMRILTGGEVDKELFDKIFKETTLLIGGTVSLPINIPGFAYNRAIQARRELVNMFQQILKERRKAMMNIAKDYKAIMSKYNIINMMLLDTDQDDYDDNEGKRLSDEKIIEVLILFAFAGYEPVATIATKAIMFLEKHPHSLQKAKEEQEDIVKRRSSSNAGLNFNEIKQMTYLNKVINETLRFDGNQRVFLRDSNNAVHINGYTIPKGWKFFSVLWDIHMDPNTYVKPEEFNPSRWDVNPEIKTYPPENCLVRFKKIPV
ncbi:hypothetical protein HAX54_036722 [Datura stramonium]|uniref:Cytochrome P450 n=1 Tax=Datura stramonium TaxID=4076 RepID=A0ABS8SGM9_DATST|nr:hypothetical protein [Datura stramonium]